MCIHRKYVCICFRSICCHCGPFYGNISVALLYFRRFFLPPNTQQKKIPSFIFTNKALRHFCSLCSVSLFLRFFLGAKFFLTLMFAVCFVVWMMCVSDFLRKCFKGIKANRQINEVEKMPSQRKQHDTKKHEAKEK